MERVYIVPGILGTEMRSNRPPTFLLRVERAEKIWVDYGRLASGHFNVLALDTDGESPHPEHGEVCFPTVLYGPIYGDLARVLARDLPGDRYTVQGIAYDWRLDIRDSGGRLADEIGAAVGPGDTATLVCHSMGGLVARAAWQRLVQVNQQHKVRRIITLGTPNRGSYGIPDLWTGRDPTACDLVKLRLGADVVGGLSFRSGQVNIGLTSLVPGQARRFMVEIIQTSTTWPSVYQLLPRLDAEQADNDPLALTVYDLDHWPDDLGIRPELLAQVVEEWHPFLAASSATPPPHVWTEVAGIGVETPERVTVPGGPTKSVEYAFTSEGDGRVTTRSAIAGTGPRFVVRAEHGDLPRSPQVLTRIVEWITEERSPPPDPPPPPPPPVEVPGELQPKALFGGVDVRLCLDRTTCSC